MGVFKRTIKTKKGMSHYWYIDYVFRGKRKWESVGRVGEVNKADAKKLLALRKTEILQDKFKLPKNRIIPTFSEFAKEYLEYAKQNKKSWERDMYSLRKLIPFFGNYKLSEISPILIERYKLERIECVSSRTVNIELVLLKRMFYLAISWDKCESNPMQRVKLFKQSEPKERILTHEEEQKLLDASPGHLRPIIITALQTGMRYSEILGLTWDNVDLEDGYIRIKESKSGKRRSIPINETLRSTLLELIPRNFDSNSVSSNSDENKSFNNHSDFSHGCAGFRIQYLRVWGFDSSSRTTVQVLHGEQYKLTISVIQFQAKDYKICHHITLYKL